MKRIRLAVLAAALVGAVAAIGASASPAGMEAKTVRVQLMDFMVMPSSARAPAGKVTFVVKNVGKAKHNFVVLKTKLASSMLSMAGAKAKEVGLVGKTPVFGPKQTRKLTLTMKSGRYLLICNVPGHYMAGMRAAFRVG